MDASQKRTMKIENTHSERILTHCASQEFIVWISYQKMWLCWVKDSI
jgi:hypothetical protein